MIVKLKGVVEDVSTNSIYLDVQGVVYEVFTTLTDLENLKDGQNIEINIIQIIREDSNTLYGFIKKETKTFFKELVKITGVGAKVAIAILSTISEQELVDIIDRADEKALVKVPKIGLKTAKRILNELIEIRERFVVAGLSSVNSEKSISIQALEQLGFNRNEIVKVVNQTTMETHQEIIKESLGKLR